MILMWIVYGAIVDLLARAIHPGDDKLSFLATIGLGILGSYAGGLIQFFLGHGYSPIQHSGFLFGILGGVLVLAVYRWVVLKAEGRSFWTGKKQ